MKKLGKLTLNEMQDLTPLTPQEQMGIKGGSTIWPVIRLIPWAWEVAGIISEHLWGSQESQPATGIINASPSQMIKIEYGGSRISYPDGTTEERSDSTKYIINFK